MKYRIVHDSYTKHYTLECRCWWWPFWSFIAWEWNKDALTEHLNADREYRAAVKKVVGRFG